MSRYVRHLDTSLSEDRAQSIISAYLEGEGFRYRDERGEQMWRKGTGALTVPQFIKAVPGDRFVHIEAWTSAWSLLPGVYSGEMDPMTGLYGAAPKALLRPRIAELERRLQVKAAE